MDEKEARIAAHICGDGWITTYSEDNSLQIVKGRRYIRKRRRYQIGYCNTREELLEEFERDLKETFGVKPQRLKNEVRTKSKRIFDRISKLGGGNSRKWFISKEIFKSSKRTKTQWIRAFFDDECTFEGSSGRIRIKSMNGKGLFQLKDLLKSIKIISNITGPNVDKSYYLTIKRKDFSAFNNQIKLVHKIKKEKIDDFIRRRINQD